jgi:hypothetical protein
MKALSQNSKTKRVFAGLLAVWMSGIVFLFCCGAMPNAKAQGLDAESCPLAKKGHCDKSMNGGESPVDNNASRFDANPADGSSFDCCGFLPQVFDKARKTENIKQVAAIATTQAAPSLPKFVFIKTAPNAFYSYRPRPLNRSGTYLKNRVFRI